MIEYKLVTTPRHDRFEEQVNELINNGWELHYGAFITPTGGMAQGLTRIVSSSSTSKSKKSSAGEKKIQK